MRADRRRWTAIVLIALLALSLVAAGPAHHALHDHAAAPGCDACHTALVVGPDAVPPLKRPGALVLPVRIALEAPHEVLLASVGSARGPPASTDV